MYGYRNALKFKLGAYGSLISGVTPKDLAIHSKGILYRSCQSKLKLANGSSFYRIFSMKHHPVALNAVKFVSGTFLVNILLKINN